LLLNIIWFNPRFYAKSSNLGYGQSSSSASYAITASGKLFSWGVNYNAQLGNFNYDHSATPIDISGNGALAGKTIVSVAAGTQHAVALDADGRVYVWGYVPYFGPDGDFTPRPAPPGPMQESNLSDIKAIAAGNLHSLALHANGTVYSWGRETFNGWVPNLSDVKAIAAGAIIL
jgi:alpha-tubulin suppressor-like RCC1 family protein